MAAPSCHIEIAFTRISHPFPDEAYQAYLSKLTPELQEKNRHFARWQDRHAHLMGKVLLLSSSIRLGTGPDALRDLKYNNFGKPLLDYLSFNISHSGEFVVCACTTSAVSLGIDVERKKPVDFGDFLNTMNPAQWEYINERPQGSLGRFYSFWVIKESVIKAEGGGLSIPLTDIILSGNTASIANTAVTWHVAEFPIHPEYAMAVAVNREVSRNNFTMREFRAAEGRINTSVSPLPKLT